MVRVGDWTGVLVSTGAAARAVKVCCGQSTSLVGAATLKVNALWFVAGVAVGIVGFGDRDLARDYLQKAIAANPDGIDPNYFYGEFLYEEEQYELAKTALLKAQSAAPRPDRPLADEGRKQEIAALLQLQNFADIGHDPGKHRISPQISPLS